MSARGFKRLQAVLAVTVLLCGSVRAGAQAAEDEGFRVPLSLSNGHLAKVILGVSEGAGAAFDRTHDSPAPPPGRGTGYTAFVDKKSGMYLYRDVKPPADTIEWSFFARVYKDKPVRITWKAGSLPSGYRFQIVRAQEDKTVDMRKVKEVTVSKTETLTFVAKKTSDNHPAKQESAQ